MGRQIVEDDDVSGPQGRDEDLFDIGQEPRAGHGAIEHHGRGHARQAQAADEGGGLPVAVRHAGPQTLTAWGAAVPAGHLGGGPRLVDEHQPGRVEIELALEPGPPTLQDVGTALFVRVRRLFLSVIRRRSKNRQIDEPLTTTPRSARAACSSARVMSNLASSSARIRSACCSMRPERRSPPRGPGRASPCVRVSCRQRIALAALTPNRAAAARHDSPPSIAATTRSRRSKDSALLIRAGLRSSTKLESEPRPLGNPIRFNQVAECSR
ncbi:Uncharacterised protein [Streptococcus pneumoniae]|nr:Uncharacterised protein [Streptococcus pneumoniae]